MSSLTDDGILIDVGCTHRVRDLYASIEHSNLLQLLLVYNPNNLLF